MRPTTITSLLLLIPIFCHSQKNRPISPTNTVAKVVLVGKSNYTYYALSQKSKTDFDVTGPGILTLNFRVRIENEESHSEPFKIRYVCSEKELSLLDIPELLPDNLKLKSPNLTGRITGFQKVTINVPPGNYTYAFYKHRTDQKVYMRAYFEAHPKPQWTEITPEITLEKKDIKFAKSGSVKSYFRITKNQVFNFSISDSTRLKIIVRPEFTYQMLDETILKIALENVNNPSTKIYKLSSFKSSNADFLNDKEKIPGSSKTFYVNLEKPNESNNIYSLKLLSGAKAAIIRVFKDENLIR